MLDPSLLRASLRSHRNRAWGEKDLATLDYLPFCCDFLNSTASKEQVSHSVNLLAQEMSQGIASDCADVPGETRSLRAFCCFRTPETSNSAFFAEGFSEASRCFAQQSSNSCR